MPIYYYLLGETMIIPARAAEIATAMQNRFASCGVRDHCQEIIDRIAAKKKLEVPYVIQQRNTYLTLDMTDFSGLATYYLCEALLEDGDYQKNLFDLAEAFANLI